MVLRAFSKIDRQRHTRAEDDHVAPENGEKRRYVVMENTYFEADHDNGDDETGNDHDCREGRTKPAEGAVHAYLVDAHECGLRDEQCYPSREGCRVKPQKEWPRRGGLQQSDSDSIAKSPERQHSHEQRHGEVEISGEKDLESTRRSTRRADGQRTPMCGMGTHGYALNSPFGLGKLGGLH